MASTSLSVTVHVRPRLWCGAVLTCALLLLRAGVLSPETAAWLVARLAYRIKVD